MATPDLIDYQARLEKAGALSDPVDDRTWGDLEMEKVFQRLDHCVTPMGAQHLYSMLRDYQRDEARLAANAKAWRVLQASPGTVAALRAALEHLNSRQGAALGDFLLASPHAAPRGYRWFYLVSVLSLLLPAGIVFSPWFLVVSVCLWIFNIVLYYQYNPRLGTFSPALAALGALLGSVPGILRAIADADLPEVKALSDAAPVAQAVRREISLVFLRREGADDLTRALVDYLNMLCLFEVSALCRAILAVNARRQALLDLFRVVARLDALQGISIALGQYSLACAPEWRSGRQFLLEDVQHPLLNNPVRNSVTGEGRSFLLTGTNMAGKTTFIKTVAVNLILAQTLGLCLARRAVLPPARVRTLITREDVAGSGQSYFYFDALELLRMVRDAASTGRDHWFVLDEVFRGTNTLERVAAGRAVLRHLARHGIVIASTHDHELVQPLQHEFDSYHFSEIIEGHGIRFDYLLRKGACPTRNAIKLLAMAGFPEEVIEEAERLAAQNTRALSDRDPDA
ncbi:MAG TPA: hypothetical protein VHH73_20520 [Verrucomicrobiae bacterium]|nr:hypothetical protein [Verrucomicrobiae bacterium]